MASDSTERELETMCVTNPREYRKGGIIFFPYVDEARNESTLNSSETKVVDIETHAVDHSKFCQESDLKRKTIEIHTLFGSLVSCLVKSLSARYLVGDLKIQLQQLAPKQVTKEVMDATTHEEILCYLDDHWTWINTGILKSIVMELGDDNDKKQLEGYECKLAEYMNTRVCKLPRSIYGGEKRHHGVIFIVKMDAEWGQYRVKDVAETKKIIADILKLPENQLFLRSVDNGCVKLTFQIPHHSLDEKLSIEQIHALKIANVIKLVIEGKVIFVKQRRQYRYASTITSQIITKPGKLKCGWMRVGKTHSFYMPY